MKLKALLGKLDYRVIRGSDGCEVTTLSCDSREVRKGGAFVCISGALSDGHDFIEDAAEKGAAALITQKDVDAPGNITVVRVKDTRYALALMSAAYFGYPAKEMKLVGVTGTKGKTTVIYMIKSILKNAGHKVGLIGTIEDDLGDGAVTASNTTPGSYDIHKYFRKMADSGCDICVMEVSSQALMQKRTAGIDFDIAVFTNLAEDHIGPNEHRDFEDYKRCKALLFEQCETGIGNMDDPYFKDIFAKSACKAETFGLSGKADIRAQDIRMVFNPGCLGVEYQVKGLMDFGVEVGLPGKFNVYNSLAAIAVCRHFKVSQENIKDALKTVKVKGRVEKVPVSDDFLFLIDYAHNAMALENLLTTLRGYAPERLVCIFGCGGNRDRGRRYKMGEVSGRLADFTVITTDNPRFEEPQAIIDDIKAGISRTGGEYIEICDRKDAIRYAIINGRKGDVIVLAGKGHEGYQEIKGVKYPMDERALIREILQEPGLAEESICTLML